MSVDLATLAIAVDSLQVRTAALELDKMAQAGGRAETATTKLTGASTALSTAVKAVAASYAVWKVAEYIKEAALLNARYETLGIVLNVVGRNAGYTSTQMAAFTDGVRKQGISLLESRQAVINMAQAQLDLSKSSQLARVAQDAAVIGGINSSEAFGRMVIGIKSGQTEILRTIGLNVSFEQSYEKLAKELKTTTGALTEGQKAQARMNAVLEEGTKIAGVYEAAMDTAGKQLTSMARYTEDLKVVIGETFNDILVVAVEGVTAGLKGLNGEARELAQNNQLREWGAGVVEVFAFVADAALAVANIFSIVGKTAAVMALAEKAARRGSSKEDIAALHEGTSDVSATYDRLLADADKFRRAADVRKAANAEHRNANAGLAAVLKDLDGLSKTARGKAVPGAVGKIDDLYFNGGLSGAEYIAAIGEVTGKNVPKSAGGTGGDKKSEHARERAIKQSEDFIRSIQKETQALGSSAEQRKIYEGEQVAAILRKAGVSEKETIKFLNNMAKEAQAQTVAVAAQKELEDAAERQIRNVSRISDELDRQALAELDAAKMTQEYAKAVQDVANMTELENSLAGETTSNRAIAIEQYKIEIELQKKILEIKRLVLDEDERSKNIQAVTATAAKEKKAAADRVAQSRTALAGYKSAVSEYADYSNNLAQQTHDVTTKLFKGMEDALVTFATTGKLSFGDLARSIIADLIRIQARALITSTIGGGGSGGFGSILGAVLGAFGGGGDFGFGAASSTALGSLGTDAFSDQSMMLASQVLAKGGVQSGPGISAYSNSIVSTPTLFPFATGVGLMGEKSGSPGEAIMPLTRIGGDLGVKVTGGGGVVNNVSIVVNTDGSSKKSESTNSEGRDLARRLEAVVKQVLIEEKRPGGMLA